MAFATIAQVDHRDNVFFHVSRRAQIISSPGRV
jgi:hypothetical protein